MPSEVSALALARGVFPAYIREPRLVDILLRRLQHETLEEIGQSYGITRERVRQLERSALGLLAQSESALELLEQVREENPYPYADSSLRHMEEKQRARDSRAVLGYLAAIPDGPFDYQKIYKEAGARPRTAQKLTGMEALEQIHRDFIKSGTTRIGSYIFCIRCKHFKHQDEFCPSVQQGSEHRVCRHCNTERKFKWTLTHRKYLSDYGKRRREDPAIRAQQALMSKRYELRKRLGLTKPRPRRIPPAASGETPPGSGEGFGGAS
jgi:hypothetical protein